MEAKNKISYLKCVFSDLDLSRLFHRVYRGSEHGGLRFVRRLVPLVKDYHFAGKILLMSKSERSKNEVGERRTLLGPVSPFRVLFLDFLITKITVHHFVRASQISASTISGEGNSNLPEKNLETMKNDLIGKSSHTYKFRHCVGLLVEPPENIPWYCPKCAKSKKAVKRPVSGSGKRPSELSTERKKSQVI